MPEGSRGTHDAGYELDRLNGISPKSYGIQKRPLTWKT